MKLSNLQKKYMTYLSLKNNPHKFIYMGHGDCFLGRSLSHVTPLWVWTEPLVIRDLSLPPSDCQLTLGGCKPINIFPFAFFKQRLHELMTEDYWYIVILSNWASIPVVELLHVCHTATCQCHPVNKSR